MRASLIPIDRTLPPDESVKGVAADILRDVVARIDNSKDKEYVLEAYYCGESSADDAVWDALTYVREKGWKLDSSYKQRIIELAASLEYGEDALEYVDFSIFDD